MTHYTLVVLSNAVPGLDEEFNDWYDSRHIPDILSLPGFTGAKRFKLVQSDPAQADFGYQYLALYEVEAESLDDVQKEVAQLTASGRMLISEAIDRSRTEARYFAPLSSFSVLQS